MSGSDRIWITWEKQRRSMELSRVLDCDLYLFDFKGKLRYPRCVYNTLKVLIPSPARIVFVQNPSMLLAAIACIYKILSNKKIIVDRHTSFSLKKKRKFPLDWIIFSILHYFTLKHADLTIVTNIYLKDTVEKVGGKAFILPDKLPELQQTRKVRLTEGFNVFLISSFGSDEPIWEAIHAASQLKEKVLNLYVSGNVDKLSEYIRSKAPGNVYFTGFLSEECFVNYIFASDAVMALTTNHYCMLCGCYEAIAAQKPLVTSDKEVLREYFFGSVFVENTIVGIREGLDELMNNHDIYIDNSKKLKQTIERKWPEQYKKIEKFIDSFPC